MSKKLLLAALTCATFIVTSGSLQAEPACGMHKGEGKAHHGMFADLDLTTDQKEQLKKLHEEMMVVRQKHFEQIKQVREKIKTELLKPDASQNVLYGYAGEMGELHKQMGKDHGDHLLKVKKVLSPEQFAKLVEKQEKMECGMKGMRHGKCDSCPAMKGECKQKKTGCPHLDGQKPAGCCPHGAPPPAE